MISFHHESMSPDFEKYHLVGLPVSAALHHFTGVDRDGPHDHPWGFTSIILAGGYVEEVYDVADYGGWHKRRVEHRPGDVFTVEATHIHRIVQLLDGDCWTLILPGPTERETRFWRFDDVGVRSAAWHEPRP